MAMTIEEFMQTEAGQSLLAQNAGLSDMEQSNVMAALQKAADEGGLEDFNVDNAVLQAQTAEEARAEAEALQAEQAKAVEEGDWEKAGDLAQQAEYKLEEVQENGGDVAYEEIKQNEDDQANLEWADYHQEIADDNADAAAAYAAEGDVETAEIYADSAADAAETASDYGAQADQGGTYAEQTVDTSSSYDASASVSSYDTSSSYDSSSVDTTAE